jgi:hypothetical protein
MGLYKELSPISNYLHQIRKMEDYLVFDMHFPNTWKILKKFITEDRFVNHGQIETDKMMLSFVSEITDENLTLVHSNILGIINYNLEREMKDRLLQSKIDELRTIFEKQTLDNLKSLKFDIKPTLEINLNTNGKSKNDELVRESQEE